VVDPSNDEKSTALSVLIMAALVGLAALGFQIWNGENPRNWYLGVAFGAAATFLATRFIATRRTIHTGERPIGVAAVGVGVLLGVAALAGILPPDRTVVTVPPPPPPPTDLTSPPPSSPSTPITATGPATRGTRGVTLTSPADGANVRRCEQFSGTAKVPDGQTLMLAVDNDSNTDVNKYFLPVISWDDPAKLSQWTGVQFFGSRDDSVGQNYKVSVVMLKSSVVKAALAKGGDWFAPTLPETSKVTLTITLHRIAGAGPAICS
jgi:hypothetical protein